MSKANKNDQPENGSPDPETNLEPGANDHAPDKNQAVNETGLLTIEEHRKNLNVSAPVFAAVMQDQNWAAGKKVPEAAFKNAIKAFLGAPMSGGE